MTESNAVAVAFIWYHYPVFMSDPVTVWVKHNAPAVRQQQCGLFRP